MKLDVQRRHHNTRTRLLEASSRALFLFLSLPTDSSVQLSVFKRDQSNQKIKITSFEVCLISFLSVYVLQLIMLSSETIIFAMSKSHYDSESTFNIYNCLSSTELVLQSDVFHQKHELRMIASRKQNLRAC